MQEWSYPSAEAAIKRPNKLTVSRDRSLESSYFEQDAATWVVNLSIHGLISKALFHLRIDVVWFMRARALKKTFPHRLDNWSCGFQRRGVFFVAGGGGNLMMQTVLAGAWNSLISEHQKGRREVLATRPHCCCHTEDPSVSLWLPSECLWPVCKKS